MIEFIPVSALPKTISPALIERAARVLEKQLKPKAPCRIGIRFVTADAIQKLNKTYRHKNAPTDVLSFSADLQKGVPNTEQEKGDLVICPSFAVREAKRRGIDPREELMRLVVHGTLHLFGFDHEIKTDEARMFGRQERLLEQIFS